MLLDVLSKLVVMKMNLVKSSTLEMQLIPLMLCDTLQFDAFEDSDDSDPYVILLCLVPN
jgi:hypothetical protein